MKIMIVEDDASSRVYLERALMSQGYSVESAANGVIALKKLEQAHPDLIISDIMMPEMDGFELCRRIKTDGRLRTIPFVFYTATYIDQKDETLAMALGASRFYIKPMDMEDFFKAIKEVIEEHLEKGVPVSDKPLAEMATLDRMQMEVLARKLEKKVRELEQEREALRASEEKYRILFDSAGDAIFIHDREGRILAVNAMACERYGYTRSEFLCMTVAMVDTPEQSVHAPARIAHLMEQGMLQFETVHGRKDGMPISVDVKARKITWNGEPATMSICRDITERKKAEDMLRKSEEFNRNILESIGQGLIVIDRNYSIISANRAYCEQQHASAEDIVGKSCYLSSHHIGRPCFEVEADCSPKRTFETGQPARGQHVHQDHAGNSVNVEIRSFPLKDGSGAVTSVIVIIEDITERRKLEEQLRQAQKMEAVGQLAGGVAHDFNNILTAIMGHAYILQMKIGEDDPLRRDIEQILTSSTRAANLTQSLLAFSRKQIINPKPVNLNETVRQVERFLHRLIGEDITFDIKIAPEAVWVMADHGQIEQVLMNLATNARDAMPDGGLLVIETDRVELNDEFIAVQGNGKSGDYAMISVSDTGTGMDEHTKRKIFEPFFTTKEEGKGTGLGLSIVYGIIKQHNGFINVYSEPGKGTTFKLYMPLIAASAEKEQPEKVIAPAGGTETLLLAEDDQATRDLSKQVLEQFGYTVIVASDGAEAMEKFIENKDRVKMVIMDVIMPKKNAKEVYDEIRKLAPEMKMLFTSGYTAEIIHKQGVLDEGLAFLSKPASPMAFLNKVREVLDQSQK